MNPSAPSLDINLDSLRRQYGEQALLPSQCIAKILERIEQLGRPEVWIARVPSYALTEQGLRLDRLLHEQGSAVFERLPLFGVPFAVKDNIDVDGMPTTAACPEFAYLPKASATVVDKLVQAGAILIGKTNLDQFATGLVGTRSPYGAVRNSVNPDYVSGGSSSGSAVAVALGMVSFSLGTDTAGSGRVPAGLNGIVGLKPSRGLLSTQGVFPACRTLDCVSVFANTVGDAWQVVQACAGYDAADPYSRNIAMHGVKTRGYRIAIPSRLEFFGDEAAERAFMHTLRTLQDTPGCEVGSIDFTPFAQAAGLLYQGPWVAERLAAVGNFYDDKREEMDPVVCGIIGQGKKYSAVDAFEGQYRLSELRRQAEHELEGYDFLLVPTTPTMPRIDAVRSEPVKRNSELGYYTNFVNFFDMAALAVPAHGRDDGLPAGVTLIAGCGTDQMLASAAQALFARFNAPGANVAAQPLPFNEPTVQLAVVGAHLEGQPLNWQLVERGTRKRATTHTAPNYALYALPGTTPPKPGLVRLSQAQGEGSAIEIEIWEMPLRRFGEFVAEIPAPLGIGTLETADGSWVKGFVCEPCALAGAHDISAFGGWRNYLASL